MKTQFPAERLDGKAFESILVDRHSEYRKLNIASIGSYGVQCVNYGTGPVEVKSLPDFEGITQDARQIIFDAKVCSQASFNLSPYRIVPEKGKKWRQLKHMLERSRFNATCFFLIHWNERELKKKYEPPITYAFPVCLNEFWERFEAAEVKSINRSDCQRFGYEIEWNTLGNARTPRPDWLAFVEGTKVFV